MEILFYFMVAFAIVMVGVYIIRFLSDRKRRRYNEDGDTLRRMLDFFGDDNVMVGCYRINASNKDGSIIIDGEFNGKKGDAISKSEVFEFNDKCGEHRSDAVEYLIKVIKLIKDVYFGCYVIFKVDGFSYKWVGNYFIGNVIKTLKSFVYFKRVKNIDALVKELIDKQTHYFTISEKSGLSDGCYEFCSSLMNGVVLYISCPSDVRLVDVFIKRFGDRWNIAKDGETFTFIRKHKNAV